MSAGKYKLDGLTPEEHRAALAAVKLVRGDAIKNAYMEGHSDGYRDGVARYKGEFVESPEIAWDKSQTKLLSESKVREGNP